MTLQIGNAACVLGNVSDRDAFEEIYHIKFLPVDCIVAGLSSLLVVFFCYWSTGIVAGMGVPTFVADHGCVSCPPT